MTETIEAKLAHIHKRVTRLQMAEFLTRQEVNGVLWVIGQDLGELLDELRQEQAPQEDIDDDLPF